jgi:DNA-binding response OmpR family regulator
VVEDEYVLAFDLKLLLEEHGFRVLGPAGTVAEALRVLATATPDAAILDVNLKGEMVTPVAKELRARGVPFVVASAYGEPGSIAVELAAAPNVGKPASERKLLAALAEALRR